VKTTARAGKTAKAKPKAKPKAETAPTATGSVQGADTRRESATEVVIITGISGSGKSVALHALEDAGFFCVDNLPPELLRAFLQVEQGHIEAPRRRIAVAVDVRTAGSLPFLVPLMQELRGEGVRIKSIFLDASTDALVRRFSETRRPHPLALRNDPTMLRRALIEAIELERELLSGLRESSIVVDTSQLRAAQLRSWIRQMVGAGQTSLTLVFESFAFKGGVPLDADFVFDVRVLPNPYYERELRTLTGRDEPVAAFLEQQGTVREMLVHIAEFLQRWLPAFENDQRSYLTVGVGCTGGQHRSVYMAEQLALRMAGRTDTLVRHRELDGRD
jgi:RNase adapter protein RapZ